MGRIENAIITGTMLGREDHGILTWTIYMESGCCVWGVGGYALDSYDRETKKRVFSAKSMESISEVLRVVGVDKWEDLPGKYVRYEDNGMGSSVTKIGNIISDKWFDIAGFFKGDSE